MFNFVGCEKIYEVFQSSSVSNVITNSESSINTDEMSYINVIMLNDNHGVLYNDGGIDKISTGINHYSSIGEVVKIANGDMLQGTYVSSTLKGLPMLDALNAMEFDAFVIGNHEFDWGLDEIKKYKDGNISNGEANFPFLGANIYDKNTNKMVDWLEPYTVVELEDIKIGIIGIIGDVETSILSTHVEDYDFVDAKDIVKDLAIELRTIKECDAVIVATHGDDDNLNATLSTYVGSSRIDGIFTGHTHISTNKTIKRKDGENIWVLQNGGYGKSFASLTLEFNKNNELQNTNGKLNITDNYIADEKFSIIFEKYSEYIELGETILCTTDEEISRYDLGINVVNIMFEKYGVDFAMINSGGIRASIEAGEVTYDDIFQVLPFENEVYITMMSGANIKSFLNVASVYYWGLLELDDNEEYAVAIIDYLYYNYTFDDYRIGEYVDTDDLIRDVFIEWIKSNV